MTTASRNIIRRTDPRPAGRFVPVARRWLAIGTLALASLGAAAVPGIRAAALSGVGAILTSSDPAGPGDLLVMTPESGPAGELEIADLYHEGLARSVLLFEPDRTPVDLEFDRRGVSFPELALDTLEQLGVPRSAVMSTDVGEIGTTENTRALAEWARRHDYRRVIVVVSPSHGRRYGRALRRAWPPELPDPVVRTSRHHPFRADTWWRSRTTLREGLVELEKLILDYLAHPL